MITDVFQLRPRYGEVDKMGYVYHANYVTFCHQARNELLRKLGLDEVKLEENQIMLPVISFDIKYRKPAHFDELITIKTTIREMPKVRFSFYFEVKNEQNVLLCKAKSDVVFVDIQSRLPQKIPSFVEKILTTNFETINRLN
ncbi:thioesterase family protein [Polaribacter sp. Q13]|uniref:acyl-CoA thioesterase n=1 Tax=Polaribacter sp. Q13 TaxID=2806551 RepID=UPI00193B637A|nr:thioesterase family protein [Polaribacter sp. Q13]QVY64196.1 acyl-CoA thioesterase [Polaribacter sp. Q13]